ncbi:MAG: hypothetical protein H0U35_03795 [Sporichthyaceae bacterium]|nr:hypothetical protein [Sporichthyaceae bacterium]
MSFIVADLIIIPILLIYRRCYGTAMAVRIFGAFYAALAGRWVRHRVRVRPSRADPDQRNAKVDQLGISWNYTTYLNIAVLVVAAALVVRFVRTGGVPMLRAIGGDP